MSNSQQSEQLHQLTSLRFFAALAVLFSHLSILRNIENPLQPIAKTVFHEGFSAIAFFYILSGFILSHTYQTRLTNNTISKKKYLLLRLARIYPLHLLTALPFALLALYEHGWKSLLQTIPNLTLLQSWIPSSSYYFSLNALSWSLSDELFFYATFIFLAPLSTTKIKQLTLTWLAIIVISITCSLMAGYGNWTINNKLSLTHYLSYINPITRLLDFLTGILIYRAFANDEAKDRVRTKHELLSVAILVSAMFLFSKYNLPQILRSQILYLPIMAYVIWSFSNGTGLLSRKIKNQTFILLGEASFALYMLHLKIIEYGFLLYKKLQLPLVPILPALLLVAISVVASIIVYKVIELPVHNYLRQRINKLS